MNDLYKDKLQIILNDEHLFNAVRAVFYDTMEKHHPLVNEQNDNQVIGEKYRAYEQSRKIIEDGFTNLLSYKLDKRTKEPFNRGK